jgi:hypothetical protein
MDNLIKDWNKASILFILKDPNGRSSIKDKWYYNGVLVYKMLQALYQRQTSFEQESKCTVEDNGIGFNGYDSGFLSDVAERSKPYKRLSQLQLEKVAKRLIKYADQLESIALEKVQQSLPVCGYCSAVGHTQQDCEKYKTIELGQRESMVDEAIEEIQRTERYLQQQLLDVAKYPD